MKEVTLAIIPARSGSKRLKNKNSKKLLKKPLITYTIEAALLAKKIDDILVSTDSDEILRIAQNCNVKSFKRPRHLATDTAKITDVLLDAIIQYEQTTMKKVSTVVLLQPTSPLRNHKHIDQALNDFKKFSPASLVSVTKFPHPLSWGGTIDSSGLFKFLNLKNMYKRGQDLPTFYHPNGAIYVISKKQLLKNEQLYFKTTRAFIMERFASVDIDTIDDFYEAEMVLKMKLIK